MALSQTAKAERTAMTSAKKDLVERIVDVYPYLSPKKRRVADFIIKDYKKVFFMTAREIAEQCRVSEPTIMRLANDMGFTGYQEFVKYLKGLLHIELTGVERLLKTSKEDEETSTLNRYCKMPEEDLKRVAKMLYEAQNVYVAGYRASATLAYYFGYILKKIRDNVFIDISLSWQVRDLMVKKAHEGVVFLIAFPRYPRKTIELLNYAKKCGHKIIVLSDTPSSPVVAFADEYLLVDMEAISFIDPFGHIITFLGALLHEITFLDNEKAMENLATFDDGVKLSSEFFADEGFEPHDGFKEDSYLVSLWPAKNHRNSGRGPKANRKRIRNVKGD
jgi:DNA-binding MurR/RpiR family transcriptional regulator